MDMIEFLKLPVIMDQLFTFEIKDEKLIVFYKGKELTERCYFAANKKNHYKITISGTRSEELKHLNGLLFSYYPSENRIDFNHAAFQWCEDKDIAICDAERHYIRLLEDKEIEEPYWIVYWLTTHEPIISYKPDGTVIEKLSEYITDIKNMDEETAFYLKLKGLMP
ncbi:hypothetical protein [Novacetimonas hansenii]|uniref:Uncharacterized protein n=1 Tax=Novacetimonas hansenii TaxID=436 RepID=A0ABQ0SGS2_NOVHA|nr:hypothetical protein [Novacetimonas hansenii]GAN84011.1 hypothetical protein Gaha_0122_011 [Novacetimonas hansenii JCM 7643]GBQ55922.1 hypothetical protein AA0243_1053 [Novacetimonas hansenii NRIC 0243]GEC64591.1 hypothetical protein GHA01_24400 [Novacetimonas hansenii]